MRTLSRRTAAASAVALVLVSLACAARSGPELEGRSGRMEQHFTRAGNLYAAVAAGNLESIHAQAAWIAENETGQGLPAKAAPYVEELRSLASLASRAPDLESAASATARLGATCGACHKALGKGPRYTVVNEPPEASTGLTTRMLRHEWAADRLWEGLIAGSDASWRAGARALRDAPLYTDAVTQDVRQYEEVTKLAWTVHDIGTRAGTVTDRSARAALYGQLLDTCARCHNLLQQIP
jgi:cytochrome c556